MSFTLFAKFLFGGTLGGSVGVCVLLVLGTGGRCFFSMCKGCFLLALAEIGGIVLYYYRSSYGVR